MHTQRDKKQRGTCGYSQAMPALRILAPVEKRSLQMKAFTGHSSPIGCYWFAKMCHICNTWRSPKVRREWKQALDALSVLVVMVFAPSLWFPSRTPVVRSHSRAVATHWRPSPVRVTRLLTPQYLPLCFACSGPFTWTDCNFIHFSWL